MPNIHHTEGRGGSPFDHADERFVRLVGGAALLTGDSRPACVEFCEQNRQIVLCCLPGSLAELAEGAGFATMLDVVVTYGGRRLYLPTREHRFLAQTGMAIPAAAYKRWRLQADVNGQIDIPSAWGLFLALRRAAIRFALAREWPTEALHSTFGMNRRQLRAYRADRSPAPAQLN